MLLNMSTLGTIFIILIPIILLASIERALYKISHSIDSRPTFNNITLTSIANVLFELKDEIRKLRIILDKNTKEKHERQKST